MSLLEHGKHLPNFTPWLSFPNYLYLLNNSEIYKSKSSKVAFSFCYEKRICQIEKKGCVKNQNAQKFIKKFVSFFRAYFLTCT